MINNSRLCNAGPMEASSADPAFVFMSAIVFLTEDENYYWTLLLFIKLLLFLMWDVMRKESADMGD